VRFPTLYLLHGTYTGGEQFINAGRLAVDLDKGITKGGLPPFLVVMPEAQNGSFLDDTEWANTPAGRYADAVLAVVHAVDRRWSTIPDRAARAIAGLSMGGYGAINITLRHLHVFGTVESWSGYYQQTPSGVFAGAPRAKLVANSPASFAPQLRARLQRLPLRVFLYTGSGDPLLSQQLAFAQELRGLGTEVRSGVLPGFHDWLLWRRELPAALRYASRPWSGSATGSVPG
jgi:enterochelin esterase-like enzyme